MSVKVRVGMLLKYTALSFVLILLVQLAVDQSLNAHTSLSNALWNAFAPALLLAAAYTAGFANGRKKNAGSTQKLRKRELIFSLFLLRECAEFARRWSDHLRLLFLPEPPTMENSYLLGGVKREKSATVNGCVRHLYFYWFGGRWLFVQQFFTNAVARCDSSIYADLHSRFFFSTRAQDFAFKIDRQTQGKHPCFCFVGEPHMPYNRGVMPGSESLIIAHRKACARP